MRSLSVDATRGDPHDVRGSDSRNNQQSDLTLTASDKGPGAFAPGGSGRRDARRSVAAQPMAFQDRHGVALLGLWQAGQQGPPSPPAPDRTIAETDVLILAGHIDRLRALRRMQ